MPVFLLKNKILDPILERKFDLEKNIQKLTEENLKTVYDLTFVSGITNQEFSVKAQEQDFYIDTLAFDEAQKSFVIIEYKKDKSFSVIDQGFAYLSAMLNHKADFVLEINSRLKRSYEKKDIDWEQSRVIFISPEFTNYQRNAINFKDLPIFLYEVKIYESGLVDYNPIKPYRTTESIGSISKDKTIQNVSKEVKVFTFHDHLEKVDEENREFFSQLHQELMKIGEGITENVTSGYIGYRFHGTNYANLLYSKGNILLRFRMKNKPKTSLNIEKLPQSPWDITPLWKLVVKDEAQLPEIKLIAQHSYKDYADRYK